MNNGNGPIIIISETAAQMLGMSVTALSQFLYRNPDLRPLRRISGDDLLWTADEVEKVREARESKRRRKTET